MLVWKGFFGPHNICLCLSFSVWLLVKFRELQKCGGHVPLFSSNISPFVLVFDSESGVHLGGFPSEVYLIWGSFQSFMILVTKCPLSFFWLLVWPSIWGCGHHIHAAPANLFFSTLCLYFKSKYLMRIPETLALSSLFPPAFCLQYRLMDPQVIDWEETFKVN